MFSSLFPSLNTTFQRIKKNPQLFWTLFVACAITVGFLIIAQMFITIAQDAQDRLINVRIGSIQDSLSQFVTLEDATKPDVDSAIANLISQNPTILEFTFYKKEGSEYVVFASSNSNTVGSVTRDISMVGQLAVNDPKNSYTTELSTETDRLYQTYRSLVRDGEVIGLIETTQTLSEADRVIDANIQRGMLILLIILIFVMFLFFRHSKIIDYTTLYEELKNVDQLKDDFISMASHELKTPLAAIRGYSEFITEAEEIPKEYREYSRRIDVSSKQLVLLVEDMLDVSRIEQGRMKFEEQKILVSEFVKKLAPDFEVMAKEKSLTFSVEQDGLTHGYIIADEGRLRQVFVNLIGNAIKYTKQGEVKVKISNSGTKIEIRVSDTGVGMSEDECSRLFEKFYRVRTDETQEIKGTGLGLWITKQLVENMKGTLSVESIKGVGTHMIVQFEGFTDAI